MRSSPAITAKGAAAGWTKMCTALLLTGTLLLPARLGTAAAEPAAEPPNVVLIMTDDQTLEQLKVMSHTKALIGDRGVTYSNFVVTDSLCCPSRATSLTGQYVHNHGVLANSGPNGGYPAFDGSTALPRWLQAAGYKTAYVGKFLNGYGNKPNMAEVPVGWDDWQGQIDVNYYNYRLNDNGTVLGYGTLPADYSTDVFAARAEQVIAESAPGRPFFLYVGVNAPHADKTPTTSATPIPAPRHNSAYATAALPKPPSFNEAVVSDKPTHISTLPLITSNGERSILARYREELESLLAADELVDRVVDALAASGELDNTVIMFTSDNGYFHGEHRIKTSKARPYEEAIKMPLLVRGPGFTPGTAASSLAANIDLAPTIAAIAGATPMVEVDGIDLRTVAASRRKEVLLESYVGECYTGLRTATETFVRYYDGQEEFYKLATDPYQLNSLHADPGVATRKSRLNSRLNTLLPDPPACQTL